MPGRFTRLAVLLVLEAREQVSNRAKMCSGAPAANGGTGGASLPRSTS